MKYESNRVTVQLSLTDLHTLLRQFTSNSENYPVDWVPDSRPTAVTYDDAAQVVSVFYNYGGNQRVVEGAEAPVREIDL